MMLVAGKNKMMITEKEFKAAIELITSYSRQSAEKNQQVRTEVKSVLKDVSANSLVLNLYEEGVISTKLLRVIEQGYGNATNNWRLKTDKMVTISDLAQVPFSEWSNFRNFGKLSAHELIKLLKTAGFWDCVKI